MEPSRPFIAVTSRRIDAERISSWLEPAQILPTYYLDALHRAGAVGASVVSQPVESCDPAALLERFDGLMVSGGIDVDPSTYGEPVHPMTTGTNRAADQWEIALVQAARTLGLPTLAICRGAQIMNVAFGGTLIQHLGDSAAVGPHGIPNGGGGTSNEIIVDPESRLAAATGTSGVIGNCHHHQAVGRLGDGLVVTARSGDEVIEAIEPIEDWWALGVQWHPEDSAMHDPIQQHMFDHLVDVVATLRQAPRQ